MSSRVVLLGRNLTGEKHSGESGSFQNLINKIKEKNDVKILSIENKNYEKTDFIARDLFTKKVLRWIRKKYFRMPPSIETVLLQLEIFISLKQDFYKIIKEFKPDLIIYHKDLAPLGCWIGKKLGIPTILRLHDYEYCYNWKGFDWNPLLKISLKIPIPLYKTICKYVLKNSNIIITNSLRTKKIYQKIINNKNIEVIYPFVNIEKLKKVKKTGDKILHVTPSKNKGIDITLDIAEKLPNEKFLIIGPLKGIKTKEIKKRMEEIKNVDYAGFIPDISDAFSKSKIVLAPSHDEGFGMIVLEAGINGIPTISSGKGGLFDSTPSSLIVKKNSTEEYIKKINEIEKNPKKFKDISIKNAEKKSADQVFEKLKLLIKTRLEVDL